MNKKKWYAGAVVLFSGGVLTLSAFVVPGIVNSRVIAGNGPAVQAKAQPAAGGSAIPVLKFEAPAPVSTVTADLLKDMSEAQIKQIYDYINKPGLEPGISGREITEAEINRRLVLEDQYVYEGLRPEQPLPLKAGQAEVYVDIETHTYTYPERTMTDEELLQLIDWSYRLNYIAARHNVTVPPLAQDISEAEAKRLAAESVNKLFDADVSKLKTKALLAELGADKQPAWTVHSAPYKAATLRGQEKEFQEYHVIIDAKTGDMLDTTVINGALKRTPIDDAAANRIAKDASWIHKATQIVMNKQGEKRTIVKASLTGTENNNKRGMVAVKLLLEDGSSYTAELRYPNQALRCLIYEPAGK
ncbi:hypothetical protein PATY110618_14460 [Paenibacillus typhae]|uniref:Uncharacterized protein n=1 Tax=Paenibacillus typhae TaxID=1174501 RepID=A0A1G8V9J6_9BACL|nr:hypothetical protein [Paenibacillus typhae]SDJ62649.1 hypothetical protein SAMN05216192_12089 [Paenibacillus typhae]